MKKMTVASLTEELGKLTEVVQNSQENTDYSCDYAGHLATGYKWLPFQLI